MPLPTDKPGQLIGPRARMLQGRVPFLHQPSTAMTATHPFVGIDVAKDRLDLDTLPQSKAWHTTNDTKGIAQLCQRLRALKPQLIVVEATGGYQYALTAALAADGLPMARTGEGQEGGLGRLDAQAAGDTQRDDENTDALESRLLLQKHLTFKTVAPLLVLIIHMRGAM